MDGGAANNSFLNVTFPTPIILSTVINIPETNRVYWLQNSNSKFTYKYKAFNRTIGICCGP